MKHLHAVELLESRIAPAGLVLMNYDSGSGELTLTGDDQANAVDIFQVAAGVFRIEGRNDAATLTGTSIGEDGNGATTINQLTKLTINLGGGNDELDLANLRTLKSLSINAGSGNDSVEAYNVNSADDVSFNTGSGVDTVELQGDSTSFGRDLIINDSEGGIEFEFGARSNVVLGQVLFNGGTGSDLLATTAAANLTIAKSITFNGGSAGTNAIVFGNQGAINVGRSASGQSVVFTGGSGVDSLSIGANRVLLKGSVEMTGGSGADVLDIDGVNVKIGRSLTGNSVLLTGGIGNDEIDIQGGSVKLAGSLKLDGGSENDLIDLTNVQVLTVGGSIELDGAVGADVMEIEAGKLRLTGGLKMLGGDDTDSVSIEADGFIGGSVELLMGGAISGAQAVEIRGLSGLTYSLKVLGGLTVDANGATAVDRFRLTNVSVAKASSLTFGENISDVDIDNLSVASTLTIDTRGGADDVRFERDAVYGESLFNKATTLLLGEGDDFLRIGKDSGNNRVSVLSDLNVNGGGGTDTRNDIELNNRLADSASFSAIAFEVVEDPNA